MDGPGGKDPKELPKQPAGLGVKGAVQLCRDRGIQQRKATDHLLRLSRSHLA